MKKRLSFICAAIAFFSFAASAVTAQQLDKKYAPIEVVTPARPAGQQDVIGHRSQIENRSHWCYRFRYAWHRRH